MAKVDVSHREARVGELLAEWFTDASPSSVGHVSEGESASINLLCEIKERSYREIWLTVLAATALDTSYRASEDFYACSPRSLYENQIRPHLEGLGIPCGQSGPLNIAKAARALDDSWAAQRRPKKAALAVLSLVHALEGEPARWKDLAVVTSRRLSELATDIAELRVEVDPLTQLDVVLPLFFRLIEDVPDGGNTPQRICGYILNEAFFGGHLRVTGHEDSAAITNSTSGKPGDISVVHRDGSIHSTFEVTVKKFDAKRISECNQGLRVYEQRTGTKISKVTVLCRRRDVPQKLADATQVPTPSGVLAVGAFDEYQYEFIDLQTWLSILYANLSEESRVRCFKAVERYINEANTSISVKRHFRGLVEEILGNPHP